MRTADRTRVGSLEIVRTRFAPGSSVPEHWHQSAFFCLVTDGAVREVCRGGSMDRRSGSLLFHPPAETHADTWGPGGGACCNIELDASWDERLGEHLPALSRLPEMVGGATVRWANALRAVVAEPPDPVQALEAEGLMLLLIAEATRMGERLDRRAVPGWVKKARDHLHDAYRSGISIDAMAQAARVHPVHLARVFRRTYGVSIGRYVAMLRVEEAARLLRGSDRRVSEIAHALGFADHSHLTRTMRKLLGRTPRDFRVTPRA